MAALASSCRRAPHIDAVKDERGDASTQEATKWRCAPFESRPYTNPDFPSPTNSDGTPKVLAPPPPNVPGHALVLPYEAFGPQAMAAPLLGSDWWSWEAGGSFEPGDSFDVRVVVHHDAPAEEIALRYPTVEKKSDYRLLERDHALRYLGDRIAELRRMMDDDEGIDLRSTLTRLAQTRSTIVECLGE